MKKIFTHFIALFSAIITITAFSSPGLAIDNVELNSKNILLIEPASGEILFERKPDERVNPASLTKIMTALLIIERGNLDDVVTVKYSALADLHPLSSTANLLVGEEISLRDLLYCVLIASGNDACTVAAEHISGSVEAFVNDMNTRAAELGCENTHFGNPHGLTQENHYTSAHDIYLITLEALKHPLFMEICNTASITIPATNMSEERYYYTTNHLISRLKLPDYIYPYAKGIKTGHTTAAGYCLVSSAEKNGLLLVSVVLGAEAEEDTNRLMSFVDTKNLFEWGFDNFSYQTMITTKEPIKEVKIRLAEGTDYVVVTPSTSLEALLPNDFNPDDVVRTVTIYDEDDIIAPITRGQKLGELTLTYMGKEYETLSLVALNSVSRDQTLYYMDQVKTFLAQKWVRYLIIGFIAFIVIYIIVVIIYNSRRKRSRPRKYRGQNYRR